MLAGYAMMFLTALIWGLAFVAQKSSMEVMGPYTFNAIRFALGATCLLLLLPLFKSKVGALGKAGWSAAIPMGVFLFLGSITQQIGIVSTTAGKAAFITGLYIIIVPLILAWVGQVISKWVWYAVALGACGMYLLTMQGLTSPPVIGDLWVLSAAVFFAFHIIVVGRASQYDALRLSVIQFYMCAGFSTLGMLIWETPTWLAIKSSSTELIYAGVLSVGVAYTLQVIAQKRVAAHTAALVLSLEAVFGALGGVWLLDEEMSFRMIVGASLMMAAIVIAQIPASSRAKSKSTSSG